MTIEQIDEQKHNMVNNKRQLMEAHSKTNRAMVELEDIYDIQSKRKEIS
jgi:uncharacterized protein YfkK (UPF0435 family)